MNEEIWKDIPGWEGQYQASTWGRIKSVPRKRVKLDGSIWYTKEKLLKPATMRDGYLMVCFNTSATKASYLVHRLIAKTFIPNPELLTTVNHINEIKTDNRVENLEWASRLQQMNAGTVKDRIRKTMTLRPTCFRRVRQKLNGQIIAIFPTIEAAGMATGTNSTAICMCCKGRRKHANKYEWEYDD